jgi:hypothetical protein
MLILLVQDDTYPVRFTAIESEDGDAILTSDVSLVRFTLRRSRSGSVLVSLASCTITSSGSDPLECEWRPADGDLALPGLYDGELVFTFVGGRIKRFPGRAGAWTFQIRSKLA